MFCAIHTTDSGSTLELKGDWVMRSAKELYQTLGEQIDQPLTLIDASQIDDIDSAGLQIIVSWMRTRKSKGLLSRISTLSPSTIDLSKLYDLENELTGVNP